MFRGKLEPDRLYVLDLCQVGGRRWLVARPADTPLDPAAVNSTLEYTGAHLDQWRKQVSEVRVLLPDGTDLLVGSHGEWGTVAEAKAWKARIEKGLREGTMFRL